MAEPMGDPVRPVQIAYSALADPEADLSSVVEQAFGPSGLGLLTVSGVPNFAALRHGLLPQAARFAALPAEVQRRYEDPASRYNFGWSRGVESLEGGGPDLNKGSFYANPLLDNPDCELQVAERYPTYCRPNIWPSAELPGLEGAFKALGSAIIGVGLLLLHHCDKYVAARAGRPSGLRDVVERSPCAKGRLLHYYPPDEAQGDGPANWCGWHTDHGSLTGLTPAMFLSADGKEAPSPDPEAGLYIKTRSGSVVRASVPEDHLAFQCGEVLQVQSGGALRATPHAVAGPRASLAAGTSRNTFAVFMQPRWDEPLLAPPGSSNSDVGIGQWEPGISFGEFSERTVHKYYR